MFVADKIDGGRLDGGDQDRPARRVDAPDRHVRDALAGDEGNPDGAAGHRLADSPRGRPGIPVGGGAPRRNTARRTERSIVRQAPALHERRNELVGRQAAKTPVFGRHDDVEAAGRTGHQALLCKPVQREPGRGGGHAERDPQFFRGEVVPAISSKAGDESGGFGHVDPISHAYRGSCKIAAARGIFYLVGGNRGIRAPRSVKVFQRRITSRIRARTCLSPRRYQTPGATFKAFSSRCLRRRSERSPTDTSGSSACWKWRGPRASSSNGMDCRDVRSRTVGRWHGRSSRKPCLACRQPPC